MRLVGAAWVRAKLFAADHALAIIVVAFTLAGTIAVGGVRWEARERAEADAAQVVAGRAEVCEALRSGQATDRLLIDTVLERSPTSGVPLLNVESFGELPPAVQQYLRDLADEARPDPDDGPTLAERLEAFRDTHLTEDDLPEFCRRSQ